MQEAGNRRVVAPRLTLVKPELHIRREWAIGDPSLKTETLADSARHHDQRHHSRVQHVKRKDNLHDVYMESYLSFSL